MITDEMIEAGLSCYSEGGCMGLDDRERREVVTGIITAANAAAWRTIESAPHETNVLLAYWDESLGNWRMEAGMASWGWRRDGVSNMSRHGQATHWMPLPRPPATPEASE